MRRVKLYHGRWDDYIHDTHACRNPGHLCLMEGVGNEGEGLDVCLSVYSAPVIGYCHKNNVFFFVDFIKESPIPYPVSPRRRIPVL